jgi:hypothetical protein
MRRVIGCLVFVVVTGAILAGSLVVIFQGGCPFIKVNLPSPVLEVFNTTENIARFCTDYASSHDNVLPSPQEIAQQVPNIRFDPVQPYARLKLYVLETVKKPGKYLYWPYRERRVSYKGADYRVILACNMPARQDQAGRYYPYSRGTQEEPYRPIYGDDLLLPGFVKTHGIPPVPGCLLKFGDKPSSGFWIPASLVKVIKAVYPAVTIPKERIIDVNLVPDRE